MTEGFLVPKGLGGGAAKKNATPNNSLAKRAAFDSPSQTKAQPREGGRKGPAKNAKRGFRKSERDG